MKSMKLRFGALVLAIIMCLGMLAACAKSDDNDGDTEKSTKKADKTAATTTADGTETESADKDDDDKDEDDEKAPTTNGDVLESAKTDPTGTLLSGSEEYLNDIIENSDILSAFPDAANGVSTYNIGITIPEMGDVKMNAVVDMDNFDFSGNLSVKAQGITAEASVWGNSDNIALKVPFLLGEKAYGIKFSTLAKDLESSTLLEALGIDIDELKAELANSGISIEDLMTIFDAERISAAADNFMNKIVGICNEIDTNVAEETITVNGKDVNAVAIEYIITKEDITAFAEAYVEVLKEVIGESMASAINMNTDDLLSELTESIKMDSPASLKIYLNKDTGVLSAIKLTVDDDKYLTITLDAAADSFDVDIAIELVDGDEVNTITIFIDEVKESGKDGFTMEIATSDEEAEKMALSFVRNISDGKYELKAMTGSETELSANGTLKYDKNSFELTVDSISTDGETIELGLSIGIKAGGTVEKLPEYTNILNMTMEELQAIAGKLQGLMGSIEEVVPDAEASINSNGGTFGYNDIQYVA